mgnify:FL=1
MFPEVPESLAGHGIALHHLATWRHVLAEAEARRAFPPETLGAVADFLAAPRDWSAAHGGRGDISI